MLEEFDVDDWGPRELDASNVKLWDASWDDDSADDYVGQQIRTALEQLQQQQQQAAAPAAQQQQQPAAKQG